tara:strand:- start:944 stop:1366 length:423 start_codon:yes stop_codon:yes gene_type:complete
MGRKSKIKPTQTPYTGELLSPSQTEQNNKVSFNFRYLQDTDKFCFTAREKDYFLTVLDRLSNVCNMTRQELIHSHDKTLRCHQIDWDSVTEDSFDIKNPDIGDDAWQFSLTSNEHGRVHGFFIQDVFYVRWLDPEHQLYQ